MRSTTLLTFAVLTSSLAACGGGGGTENAPDTSAPTSTAADSFTQSEAIRSASIAAEGEWNSVTIASVADPRSIATPQLMVASPQAVVDTTGLLNVIKLQETEDSVENYFARKQAVVDLCTSTPLDCERDLVLSGTAVTTGTPQEVITGGDFYETVYVYNGRTYSSGEIDINETDGENVSVGYICEIVSSGMGDFFCIDGTVTAFASGTPLKNLPTSGTAKYAAIIFGAIKSGNLFDGMRGSVEIVVNLSAEATSSGTINGVTQNNTSNTGNVTFSGDIVIDNSTGLMGSSSLTVSYSEIQQSGLMLGWIHGDGGTLTSGYIGSTPTDQTGFNFEGAFAGVKINEVTP